MASRLNHLFQTAPRQYLEKTVLFSNELTSPEYFAMMRNRLTHHFDIQPLDVRTTVRVLPQLHLYADAPLTGYFVMPGESTMVPRNDTPFRFVFLPEFTCCRVKLRTDGENILRFEVDQGLVGIVPPVEKEADSRYVDSFAYWDHTTGDLVGKIRGTAVIVKEMGQPWTIYMQQIVGTPGFEVVRMLFSRQLRY